MSNELAKFHSAAKELDVIRQSVGKLSMDIEQQIMYQISIAELALRVSSLVTPEYIAKAVLPLKNKGGVGFKTDGEYSVEVISNIVTEAYLSNVRLTGNELNVIKGNLFRTKFHYRRVLREHPNLSDLRIMMGDLRMQTGGARVDASASWKLNGKPMSLELVGQHAVFVKGTTADEIIGKAERKIMARVYADLTGSEHDDGEIDDPAEKIDSLKVVSGADTETQPKPVSQNDVAKQALKDKAAAQKTADEESAKAKAQADVAAKQAAAKTKAETDAKAKADAVKTKADAKAKADAEAATAKAPEESTESLDDPPEEESTAPADPGAAGPAGEEGKPKDYETIETTIVNARGAKDTATGKISHFVITDASNTRYTTENRPLAEMGKKAKEKGNRVTLSYRSKGDQATEHDLLAIHEDPASPAADTATESNL